MFIHISNNCICGVSTTIPYMFIHMHNSRHSVLSSFYISFPFLIHNLKRPIIYITESSHSTFPLVPPPTLFFHAHFYPTNYLFHIHVPLFLHTLWIFSIYRSSIMTILWNIKGNSHQPRVPFLEFHHNLSETNLYLLTYFSSFVYNYNFYFLA